MSTEKFVAVLAATVLASALVPLGIVIFAWGFNRVATMIPAAAGYLVGFAIGEASRFSLTPRTFAAMAYLTIFGSIIAYSAYVFALANLRTIVTSLYAYVNPVVAVFLGWLILSEPLTAKSIMAMIVILVGVGLVQSAGWKKKPVSVAVAESVKKAA